MKVFAFILLPFLTVRTIAAPQQTPERIWIADVTIISPENLSNVTVGNVLIENGRIVRVEHAKGEPVPAGATVVSGKGEFLIPGLIDSHVHLTLIPGMSDDQAAKHPKTVNEYFRQLPRSYLYYGFTTVIDLGVAVDHRRMEDIKQASFHPDVFGCGDALVLANGYPMALWPPETRFKLFPNFIYDPEEPSGVPTEYQPREHTPAAAVAAVNRAGGICVKTFFERGFGQDTNLPVISPGILAEVRKQAREAGLPLILHANSFEAQKFGVDGNVDILAHGMWNWGDLDGRTELPPEIEALLDRIVQEKIGYQATMQVIQGGFRAYFDSGYLATDDVRRVVPAELLMWFNSTEGGWFKQEITGGRALSDAAARSDLDGGPIRRGNQVVAYLAARNALFLFGTDTPSAHSYGNLPGLNGYLEIQDLCRAGLSLRQILSAATIDNARAFHLDSQFGTIEPGKMANLLLLRKSPLESVDAYDSIVAVWVHGKQIARSSLAANLRQ